jgi:hypothetical protein
MGDQPMSNSVITRRSLLRAFAATTVAAAPVMANATGLLRGAGDIRRIRMYNGRAGESLDMIYWIEGEYIRPALEEITISSVTGVTTPSTTSTPARSTSSRHPTA